MELIQQVCNFKFCPACVFLVGDLHNQTAAGAALLQGEVTEAFSGFQFLLVNPSNQTVSMAFNPQFQGNCLLLPWASTLRHIHTSGLLLPLILLLLSDTIQGAPLFGNFSALPYPPKSLHPHLCCTSLQTLLGNMHACILEQYPTIKSYIECTLQNIIGFRSSC